MGSKIQCFLIVETSQILQHLRRYRWSKDGACASSGFGFCNAETFIGQTTKTETTTDHGDLWPHSDPRWPKVCKCGYVFQPSDPWQYDPHTAWKRDGPAFQELFILAQAPLGSMWDATWMGKRFRGPDGKCLVVKTPGGDWPIDGPSYSGGKEKNPHGWTRTGTPPRVTARPSILIPGKYHGFLTDGFLEEC